ncbi:MAG: GDP-L-fucose synthase [Planctomycetota bacterium]
MDPHDRIYVAGHRGLVGTALAAALVREGCDNLITRSSAELDLRDQAAVQAFFRAERPDYVFLVAGRVGGIHANATYPAEFLYDNLMIAANVIHAAHVHGVRKLLFTGSSCIYPKAAPQPMREECLLSGPLEPTNEAYAVAKIAGIKLCQTYRRQFGADFIAAQPTNLYGPHDNFHPENAHVMPALIRRFHEARLAGADRVTMWGTGTPRREFLFVDDLVAALVFLMRHYDGGEIVNVGTGTDVTIRELGELVARTVGFKGRIEWDASKPDGTPRKLLDVARINALGWRAATPLDEGLDRTYRWFTAHAATARQ